MRSDLIELEGVVVEHQHNFYKVEVEVNCNKIIITCTLSGKLRINRISVLVGDRVKISVSPYDLTKGILTFRFRN